VVVVVQLEAAVGAVLVKLIVDGQTEQTVEVAEAQDAQFWIAKAAAEL